MVKRVSKILVAGSTVLAASTAFGAFTPYGTPDSNTLHLYHFDETAGTSVEGNPFADAVTAAGADLTNTGGPNGRSGTLSGGGYGGVGLSGYGSAFQPLRSGNGNANNGQNATGGGASTAAGVPRTGLTGAGGAFTWEAVVRSDTNLASGPTNNWYVVSHDGADNNRGSSLQIQPTAGNLVFTLATANASGTPTASTDILAAIPRTGDNAFAIGQWFHVAVTYDGNEGVANNLKFYWTKLSNADPTAANLIGTGTLNTDLVDAANRLFVGGNARNVYRHEFPGRVDEVRISGVARAADDFGNVPEPAGLAVLAGGVALLGRRRGRSL